MHQLKELEANELSHPSKMPSNFLKKFDHKICVPLETLVQQAQKLLNSPLSSKQRKDLTDIKRTAEQVATIACYLRDFWHLNTDSLEPQQELCDLRATAEGIVSFILPTAREKNLGLQLIIDEKVPLLVYCHTSWYEQVLSHLLDNAVQFTSEGRITTKITFTEDESGDDLGGVLETEIKDTGVGIPLENQQAIFEIFQQGHDSTPWREGCFDFGLGLALASQLIKRMGGTLCVKSQPRKGSTFLFTIPIRFPSRKESTLIQESTALPKAFHLQRLYALQIGEDFLSQNMIRLMLEHLRHSCLMMSRAAEMREMLRRQAFDLLFIDLQFPPTDQKITSQYLQELKETYPKLRLIGITSEEEKDQFSSYLPPLSDILLKPVIQEALAQITKQTLHAKKSFIAMSSPEA